MKKQDITVFLKQNKNFSLLWTSQGLSQISLNMINFVMATKIYEKTGSTLAVSFLWVFYYLPSLLLGPISGYFVDYFSLRKILILTNFLQFITMLLFLFAGGKIYLIYSIVFLYSLLNQFYYPAEGASVPWLVKKEDLPVANGLFVLTVQVSLLFGLGFSGILMRLFGKDNPVYVSALCLLLAAVAVYFLPKKEPPRDKASDISDFFEKIKEGYSYIKNNKVVLFPVGILTFFQIILVALAVTVPEFAVRILNLDVQDAGPLLILPIGLGALAGIVLMAKYFHNFRKKVLIKKGLIGSAVIVVSIAWFLPYLGNFKTIIAPLIMFILGLSGIFVMVPCQTLIQENIPPDLRGRVFGALGFIGTACTLPFLIFSASIVELLGIKLFMLVISLFIFFIIFSLDKAEALIIKEKNGD